MLLDLCRKNEGNPFSTKIWVVGSYTDTLLNPPAKKVRKKKHLDIDL